MEVSKNIFHLETETAFAVLEKANKMKSEGKDIINLGIGQPDFTTPQNIVHAAIKALKDGHHGYTPSNGILELREAVANYIYKNYQVNISPENILITPGGKPVIFFAALILGNKDSEVIYPDPGFPIYRSMIKYSGAKPVPLYLKEEDNFEINLDDLSKLINSKTKLVIINNPNNPTGSFMSEKKIKKIVELLENYPNITILSDEIYSKIIFDGNAMPSFLKYDNIIDRLIILEGWSKTFCMTGWRLGWSVWPKKLIQYANKLCVNDHSCPSSFIQYAGVEALEGSQDEVKKIVSEFEKRRNFLYLELNKLDNIECFKPGGAFYAFPNVTKSKLNGEKFSKIALENYGVALVPGKSFGDFSNNYVRISYANSIENIEKAIYKISKINNEKN